LRGYEFTRVRCDYCGSNEQDVVARKRGAQVSSEFTIVRCRGCGFIFVNPRLCDRDIAGLYDDEYYAGHGFDRTIAYESADKDETKRADIAAMLAEAAGSLRGKRCLDVGCGNGLLVAELRQREADAWGQDSSAAALAICRDRGVPVFPHGLFDPRLNGQRFDIVTAIEVIEHVTSPTQFLARLRELLAPNGILFIGTGSWELVRRQPGTPYLMPEGHIGYFTPPLLARFFQKAGLTVDWQTLNRTWIGWRIIPGRPDSRLRETIVRTMAAFARSVIPSVGPFPLARLSGSPTQ
jgi:SAM-dependent methyltransferase